MGKLISEYQTGIACPIEVWNDKELSPVDIVAYMNIDVLANKGQDVTAELLAQVMKCSIEVINKSITRLKNRGWTREE